MRRRRRRRLRWDRIIPVAAVALAVLAGVGMLVALLVKNIKTRSNKPEFDMSATVVVIRDENDYYSEFDFGKIDYFADEGETVQKDEALAAIYKLGYTGDVAQKLYNVQQEIYEKQMSLLTGISMPEVDAVQNDIDRLLLEIRSINEGDGERRVREVEPELNEALERRSSILKSMVQPTEELSELYKEEESRKKQLDSWVSRVVSAADGTFSSYHDGLEQSLCMDKLDILTPNQLKSALSSSGYSVTVGDDGFMYRIVNPSSFCVGALLKNDHKGEKPEVNKSYMIRFKGDEQSYSSECIKCEEGEEYTMYLFRINEDVGKLISVRKVDAHIYIP